MRHLQRISILALVVLLTAGLSSGCGNKDNGKTNGGDEGHAHPEKGPHGGFLAVWGDEKYHAEILVDRKEKKFTVYVLDGEVKEMVPIEAETLTLNLKGKKAEQFKLKANPQKSDPEKRSSRFELVNDRFGEEEKLRGYVVANIKGEDYEGEFDEAKKGHSH